MHSAPPPHRLWLYAALAVAVLVRVVLLADKPFWRDEAWVATIVEAPLAATIAPERPRPVPIGFVALTKLTRALPVAPEVAYRLLPLAAGIALVPLLGRFAAALGASATVSLVVVWVAAGLPALVYYSRELKSYGLDALLAVAVPLLALHLFGRAAGAPRRDPSPIGAALFAALVAAPWLSFASLFVVGATLSWGWLAWWRTAEPTARRWWLAASAGYAASFLVAFRLAVAVQSSSTTLLTTWSKMRFADGAPLTHLGAAGARYARILVSFTFPELWWLALPLLLLGAFVWPRIGRGLLLWSVAACWTATVAAALADRYLIAEGRLLLFAAPPLILFFAAGMVAVADRLRPGRGAPLALGAAAALAVGWSATAIAHRLPPYTNDQRFYFRYDILHDIAPLLDAATRLVAPGEPVYVAQYASRPFEYYSRGRFDAATVCATPCNAFASPRLWTEALAGRGWMFVADDEIALVERQVRQAGASVRVVARARGMALWEVRR